MKRSPFFTSLLTAYPFSFLIGSDNSLSALGRFFKTRHPGMLCRSVADYFALSRQGADKTTCLANIIRSTRQDATSTGRIELVFTRPTTTEDQRDQTSSDPQTIRLVGALLPGDVSETCLFLGTIAPSDLKNMTTYGLTVSDFGPIDPTPEFAMMAEVNAGMLADSQVMNDQLRASRDQALAAKRELELHREHLEELVRQRTATIERQAAELNEALQHEKRLSEMQRSFVSMTSHEFRTPLAIIDGYAQRLEQRLDPISSDRAATHIEKIRSAVKRMTSLMESTLAAARMEAGKLQISPKPIDIQAILSECCEMQQDLAVSHVIDLQMQDMPNEIISDPGSVTQIVTNLLSNAIKYSPNADRIDVRCWHERDGIALSVSDHGLGIDDDDQHQIFTRFFRAKTSVGIPGTGIGLNLCRELAEELGGSLSLQSKKGEGSTFTLRLPLIAMT